MPGHDFTFAVQRRETLDRGLPRAALAAIGISGTLGIGIFITSGQLIATTGSLGTFIAYIVASVITASVMLTIAEMVAARPVAGALIDFPNTFASGELGFTVGWMYWISQCLCMATLNAATARIADNFSEAGLDDGQRAGLIVGLVAVTAASNLIGVRTYGRIERVVSVFKLLLILLLVVLCIGVICGLGGPRNQGEDGDLLGQASNFTRYGITPGFRPDGFRSLTEWATDTQNGTIAHQYGIPGSHGGRLFAILTAIALAMFSCMGGDQVIMTAGEAKDPWNDLPAVTQFIYCIPLIVYPILALLVGFTVNYADPQLFRMWAEDNLSGSHSPFIIALQSSGHFKSLTTTLNAFFLLSAYTCGNTALYVSSRTFLFICQEDYAPRWMSRYFGKTNSRGTPQRAIVFSSIWGFFGLLGVWDRSWNAPVIFMAAFFTGSIGCVYISQCWAFLRFRKGLELLEKHSVFSRAHPLYRRYLFKSHPQPTLAYFGMFGTAAVIIVSGVPSIWLLCNRDGLRTSGNIKSQGLLAADLISAYLGPLLFGAIYLARRTYRSEVRHLDEFTVSMYVLQDETLYGNSAAATGRAAAINSGSVVSEHPEMEVIKRHLEGHGRIKRSFWTEMSLFLIDRDLSKAGSKDEEGRASRGGLELKSLCSAGASSGPPD